VVLSIFEVGFRSFGVAWFLSLGAFAVSGFSFGCFFSCYLWGVVLAVVLRGSLVLLLLINKSFSKKI
jgi:hypothetical protein